MIVTATYATPQPEEWPSRIDRAISVRRCSHPRCLTSLDEFPIECPHALPFCEFCTWEEACGECAGVAA